MLAAFGAATAAEPAGRAAEKPLDLTLRSDAGGWSGVRDQARPGGTAQSALPLRGHERERQREQERAGARTLGPPYGAGYEARVAREHANAIVSPMRPGAGVAPAAPPGSSAAIRRGHR